MKNDNCEKFTSIETFYKARAYLSLQIHHAEYLHLFLKLFISQTSSSYPQGCNSQTPLALILHFILQDEESSTAYLSAEQRTEKCFFISSEAPSELVCM